MGELDFMQLLLSIVSSLIATFVAFPITSDVFRGRLFGRKQNALINAKNELFETLEGMILSGQTVKESAFRSLADNISKKYGVDMVALGDKDNYLALILQAVNCSKALPSDLKRDYSSRLQKQLEGFDDQCDVDTPIVDNNFSIEIIDDWREKSKNEEKNQDIYGSARAFSLYTAIFIGVIIGLTMYVFTNRVLLTMLVFLCLAIFAVCSNILISLIGNKEQKNIDFFRRLVYKVMSLIALTILMLVSIIFLWR